MNLLPLTNPKWGLAISEHMLSLVEVTKGWKHRPFKQVKRIPLPDGIMKLSSAKPNILQAPDLHEQLQHLRHHLRTPLPLAVSLPDLCARTCVFEFSQFPQKVQEQRALLNWRFQQDLKLDTTRSRLSYAVYAPLPPQGAPLPANPDNVLVLGTAIRQEIVEQFEQACLAADLLPVSVGISGLDIFDLYQETMQEILDAEQRRTPLAFPGGLFIYLSHWGFTLLAFKDNCPQYIRTKAITIREENSADHDQDTQEDSLSPEAELAVNYPSYTTVKVTKEILATIQYYLETYPLGDPLPQVMNIFVATDLRSTASLLPSAEQFKEILKACHNTQTVLQLTTLSSMDPINPKRTLTLSEVEAGSALPGFARLRVA